MNDPEFDVVWRAFAKHDAQMKPRPRVRLAVMAAWDAAHRNHLPRRSARRYMMPALVALAASMIMAIGLVRDANGPEPDTANQATPHVRVAHAQAPNGPASIFRLTADPAFETEPLEIVRLRLPRTSLGDIGVALVEPDASSLVDVDVVVGLDGLPRAIHRVRPVADIDMP